MLNIVWVLWALKIAGLTTIADNTLWLLTIIFVSITVLLQFVKNASKEYATTKTLEKLGETVGEDKESILTLLILIFKKL